MWPIIGINSAPSLVSKRGIVLYQWGQRKYAPLLLTVGTDKQRATSVPQAAVCRPVNYSVGCTSLPWINILIVKMVSHASPVLQELTL